VAGTSCQTISNTARPASNTAHTTTHSSRTLQAALSSAKTEEGSAADLRLAALLLMLPASSCCVARCWHLLTRASQCAHVATHQPWALPQPRSTTAAVEDRCC
jgi:hypothetical protein